jgi:hypothetical protein
LLGAFFGGGQRLADEKIENVHGASEYTSEYIICRARPFATRRATKSTAKAWEYVEGERLYAEVTENVGDTEKK